MHLITGIQQIGVGVRDANTAYTWYKRHFGATVQVFADEAIADRMGPYTQNEARRRYAILAVNMRGGGGFEIWQYKDREPQPADFEISIGDFGFLLGKLKCTDAHVTRAYLKNLGVAGLSEISSRPDHRFSFLASDPYGNRYEIVEEPQHFVSKRNPVGGVYGAVVGCSDVDRSIAFYSHVLGYDQVVYDTTDPGSLRHFPGGEGNIRRVLLRASKLRKGAFAPFMGPSEIELVHRSGSQGRRIFRNRDWGDLGFIHLCFDVRGMDDLKEHAARHGAPFTVDTGESFDMGEAAGRFAYCEDPDGALIEFVETHKLPLIKKLNWSIDLRKRPADKSLPRLLLRALELS